jgi:ankyrin repeat protein
MSARDIDEYADCKLCCILYEGYFRNLLESDVTVYYCGMLSRAILAKSPEKVEKALRNFPNTINERNKLGQTPLHLAADWP